MALKYLKDTEVNINNVLVMTGDFNIRDHSWDQDFLHYSIYRDTLIDITDFFQLELSEHINRVPTRYSDNQHKSNLVINLMFLRLDSLEHNNHSIYPDWCLTFDYVPLIVNISIFEENIQTRKHTLVKDSEEEDNFIINLIEAIKGLNTSNTQNKEKLEYFASCIEKNWYKHSKIVNITKHSKV